MKIAIRQKRRLTVEDIDPETGVLAISEMADQAFERGECLLAAELAAIAINTLDAVEFFAWRNKELAKKEKKGIFEKMELLADDDLTASVLTRRLTVIVKKAKHEDTILGSAKIVDHFCSDPNTRETFREALRSRNVPFESPELKRLRAVFGAARSDPGKNELLDELIDQTIEDDDRLYQYVNFIIAKGAYARALDIVQKKRKHFFERSWCLWDEKECEILEKLGDIESVRKKRNFAAFEIEVRDEDYFRNYDEMKRLCPEDEWNSIQDSMIEDMKRNPSGAYSMRYIKFLSRERQIPELYQICQKHPICFGEAYEALHATYSDSEDELFEKFILALALTGNTQTVYKRVCAELRTFQKRGFDIERVKAKLVAKYPNRPNLEEMLKDLPRA
ncbi:MAG: hypothetical protein LBT59_22180 [Clostridiales bacterium]|nr:hypothetical protein [Clostridiales bacterium]